MKIAAIRHETRSLPLRQPYHLSFGTLERFESSIITVKLSEGGDGTGEVTALPGYGDETAADVAATLDALATRLTGTSLVSAREAVAETFDKGAPFAASALGTALDLAEGRFAVPSQITVPLLWPIAANKDATALCQAVTAGVKRGYKTIKVKVGRDFDADLSTLAALAKLDYKVSYRFDANQGYDFEKAQRFLGKACATDFASRFEYLEQPFHRDQWNLLEACCRAYPNVVMLDESIYSADDIRRAESIGAKFVKLKLCKTQGPLHLLELADLVKDLGMRVVLGNGVATDICNLVEAAVYSVQTDRFWGAFEGNGYLKLQQPLLEPAPVEISGSLRYGY